MIKRQAQLIFKEETEYAETIFQLDFTSVNVDGVKRTTSIIPAVNVASIWSEGGQNLSGAATELTKHRCFQAVQPSKIATATEHRHRQEINPAPLIFAALMIGVATFHSWGMWQYYRGSVDNRVECKR